MIKLMVRMEKAKARYEDPTQGSLFGGGDAPKRPTGGGKGKLVPKKVSVSRGGKNFQQTVWVKPGEGAQASRSTGGEKSPDGFKLIEAANEYAAHVARGDRKEYLKRLNAQTQLPHRIREYRAENRNMPVKKDAFLSGIEKMLKEAKDMQPEVVESREKLKALGEVEITSVGDENVYFEDKMGWKYFVKTDDIGMRPDDFSEGKFDMAKLGSGEVRETPYGPSPTTAKEYSEYLSQMLADVAGRKKALFDAQVEMSGLPKEEQLKALKEMGVDVDAGNVLDQFKSKIESMQRKARAGKESEEKAFVKDQDKKRQDAKLQGMVKQAEETERKSRSLSVEPYKRPRKVSKEKVSSLLAEYGVAYAQEGKNRILPVKETWVTPNGVFLLDKDGEFMTSRFGPDSLNLREAPGVITNFRPGYGTPVSDKVVLGGPVRHVTQAEIDKMVASGSLPRQASATKTA